MILAIRTDAPEAQLILIDNDRIVDTYQWYAHRELSDTILVKIETLLHKHNTAITDLEGIVVYKGPGSFTGLRIGVTVANTLAYSYRIPIIGATGKDWMLTSVHDLPTNIKADVISPEYGQPATITKPRK